LFSFREQAVRIAGLSFAYPSPLPDGSPVRALRGIDLDVEPGAFCALMGPVGAGKSTLCLALNGAIPHVIEGDLDGTVVVGELDTRATSMGQLAARVGLVLEDVEAQLFNASVADEIAFGLEGMGLPPPEIEARIRSALAVVGLTGFEQRVPRTLSGGQQKRLALASVLAMRPRLLVLDEPTSGLDPRGRHEVLAAIDRLRRQEDSQMTVVMASQDAEAAARFADRVLVLRQGRIVLDGSPQQVFSQVERLDEWGIDVPQLARLAYRLGKETGRSLFFVDPGSAVQVLAEMGVKSVLPPSVPPVQPTRGRLSSVVQSTGGRLPSVPSVQPTGERLPSAPRRSAVGCAGGEKSGASAEAALFSRPGELDGGGLGRGPALIEVRALSHQYAGAGGPALSAVDLEIRRGEWLAVVGVNGSGKSTLIRHLNGLLKPTLGCVVVEGQDTRASRIGELARMVSYLPQNPGLLLFSATVRREVAYGPRQLGLRGTALEERVAGTLELLGLSAFAEHPPAVLGYGLRRQVALASVLAMDAPVLALDEPTVGLDRGAVERQMDVIAERHRRGTTVVLITHDLRWVARYAQRVAVLCEGRLVGCGPSREILGDLDLLSEAGLDPLPVTALAHSLGLPAPLPLSVEELQTRLSSV
jgi:energy-coupling factor transport system ATP-binding protein